MYIQVKMIGIFMDRNGNFNNFIAVDASETFQSLSQCSLNLQLKYQSILR